ncbi:MAG: hypothetical protein IJI71_03275 [Clostridia bacterium]|nr:hypothetical protein [Eggerthellaceae bacterium]MBQ6346562.1 hypothetical protein [Clostridia bacterium]
MALIDEYKQAIQDVLDGRAKPAPRPSELPWSEDKAATMWAAAAAELIAEDSAGGGGGGGSDNILVAELSYHDNDGDSYYELDASYNDIDTALTAGKPVFAVGEGIQVTCLGVYADYGLGEYKAYFAAPVYNGVTKWSFEAMDTSSHLEYYPS